MARTGDRLPEMEDVDVEELPDEICDHRRDEELRAATENLRILDLRVIRGCVDGHERRDLQQAPREKRHEEADQGEKVRATPAVEVVRHVGQKKCDRKRN